MQHYFGSSSPGSYYTLGRTFPRDRLLLPWRDTQREKYYAALLTITSSIAVNVPSPPCPYRPGQVDMGTELRGRPLEEQGAAGERFSVQEEDSRRPRVDECR